MTLGAFRLPERFSPGSFFDFVLNSHNLMHVLCVGGSWAMNRAVVLDFHWFEDGPHCPREAMRHWFKMTQ